MRRPALVLSTLLVGAALLAPPAADAARADGTCQGRAATITGSQGTVRGTAGPDVIVATGEVGRVVAGAGDDLICLVDTATARGSGPVQVDTGAGDDAVDARAAGRPASVVLGPGADSFRGSRHADVVVVGDIGGDGIHRVRTGRGPDRLVISGTEGSEVVRPVDARLGRGDDTIGFQGPTSVDASSRFDLGPGGDGVAFSDDWGEPGAGETALLVDLTEEVATWHGTTIAIRDVEDVTGFAARVVIVGDDGSNTLFGHGCDVDLRGRAGDDRLRLSSIAAGDVAPPLSGCAPPVQLEARGGTGDDRLVGGRRHDVLLGGPGHDRAWGGSAGGDVCVAEQVRGAGCRS